MVLLSSARSVSHCGINIVENFFQSPVVTSKVYIMACDLTFRISSVACDSKTFYFHAVMPGPKVVINSE